MQRKLSGNYNTQPSKRKLSGLESTKSNQNGNILSKSEIDSAIINRGQPLSTRNINIPYKKLTQKTEVQNEISEKGFLESSSRQRISVYSRGPLIGPSNTQQNGCEIVYKAQNQTSVVSVAKKLITFSGLKNDNLKLSKAGASQTERSRALINTYRSKQNSKQVNNENVPAQTARLARKNTQIQEIQNPDGRESVCHQVSVNKSSFERLVTRQSIYQSYIPDMMNSEDENLQPEDKKLLTIDYEKSYLLSIIERLTERQNMDCHDTSDSDLELRVSKSTNYAGSINFITKIVDRVKLKERVLFLSIELYNVARRNSALSSYEPTVVLLTTIWIAAKFEDAWAPFSNQFFKLDCVITSKQKMMIIEGVILSDLNFNLNLTLAYDFFEIFAFVGRFPPKAIAFGTFALNLLLSNKEFRFRNRKTFAFALCCVVAKIMRVSRFWADRTIDGRPTVGFWIQGGLQRSKADSQAIQFRKYDPSKNGVFDVCFDAYEVQEEEKCIFRTLKRVILHAGAAISARYAADDFFRISKSNILGSLDEF